MGFVFIGVHGCPWVPMDNTRGKTWQLTWMAMGVPTVANHGASYGIPRMDMGSISVRGFFPWAPWACRRYFVRCVTSNSLRRILRYMIEHGWLTVPRARRLVISQ